jgi:hypothetical protein
MKHPFSTLASSSSAFGISAKWTGPVDPLLATPQRPGEGSRIDSRRITCEEGRRHHSLTTRWFSIQQNLPESDIVASLLDTQRLLHLFGSFFGMGIANESKSSSEILLLNIPSYPAEINERHNRTCRPTCEL